MSMTRNDFELVAKMLNDLAVSNKAAAESLTGLGYRFALYDVANEFAALAGAQNARFDKARFLKAALPEADAVTSDAPAPAVQPLSEFAPMAPTTWPLPRQS